MINIKEIISAKYSLNIMSGLLYQFVNSILGLILPYLFITNLGSEANGLLNSISQLFICLKLLEAGVGTATLQALYRPISLNDKNKINNILSASNYYYIKTGWYYTACIIICCLIYPYFVDSKIDNFTIRIVILLQGMGQIISYFVQTKYTLLLTAEGKNYILNLLLLFECIFRNIGKIIMLKIGLGLISVQIIHLLTLCIHACIIYFYIRYKYKWIDLHSIPDFSSISQKTSVLKQTIAWLVFNHTSILVLTILTRNLSLVSIYSIYLLIFESVQNVNNVIRDSYKYKIGFHIQKSKLEFTNYFSIYSILIFAFTYASFCFAYILSTPFIKMYTSNVTDANYMLKYLPELFIIYKILYCIRATNRQVIETGGYFKASEKIAILETIINLISSIILTFFYSIYGVLFGVIISLIYSTIYYTLFNISNAMTNKYKKVILYSHSMFWFVTCLIIYINNNFNINIKSYIELIEYGIIYCCIIFIMFLIGVCLILKKVRSINYV